MPAAVDAPTRQRLDRFVALLLRWNTRLNLIAPRDANVVWDRHVADSLQLTPLIPPGVNRAIDLGSGGGFPGLVLAIATGIHFDLIESDQRKAAFLRSAALEAPAPVTVHACRIEASAIRPAALVTARALAPLPRLLPLVHHCLTKDGVCLLLKGARADAEIAEAEIRWTMSLNRTQSQTSPEGLVLSISRLHPKAAG